MQCNTSSWLQWIQQIQALINNDGTCYCLEENYINPFFFAKDIRGLVPLWPNAHYIPCLEMGIFPWQAMHTCLGICSLVRMKTAAVVNNNKLITIMLPVLLFFNDQRKAESPLKSPLQQHEFITIKNEFMFLRS